MSPDNAPKSHDVTSSMIRPDIFLLLGMADEAEEWENKLKELKDDHAVSASIYTLFYHSNNGACLPATDKIY